MYRFRHGFGYASTYQCLGGRSQEVFQIEWVLIAATMPGRIGLFLAITIDKLGLM